MADKKEENVQSVITIASEPSGHIYELRVNDSGAFLPARLKEKKEIKEEA